MLLPLGLLLVSLAGPALAQQDFLPDDAGSVGMIKGTEMMKSEFRARAYTQMLAAALCAHAYYLEYNELPEDFYQLYNSGAWNLDLQNIFSGRAIDAVYYDPESVGKTNIPSPGLMAELRPLDTSPPLMPPSGPGNADNPVLQPMSMSNNPLRVDPSDVPAPSPGDLLYYTNGRMLQLVIFAPDGTFVEYVQSSPDQRWLSIMSVDSNDYEWPFDVYTAEVLLFAEELLPQYYNLYKYMSDQGDIPRHQFASFDAQQRIDMAAELGITIWNPYSKRPITASEVASRGDFLMLAGAPPTPLLITIEGDREFSLADAIDTVGNAPGSSNPIFGVPGASKDREEKPKRRSKHGSFGSR
ncbi:MAG: hypothetical protein R3F46_15950 [bacterium]